MAGSGILKLLKNLKLNKAASPDKLKPLLLQQLRVEIAPILQVIFKCTILTGKLPENWCRAQVAPIFKKGEVFGRQLPTHSLTCILCKVLEHIMVSHVVKHMDKHDLLYDLQPSFREKRSYETQLASLV